MRSPPQIRSKLARALAIALAGAALAGCGGSLEEPPPPQIPAPPTPTDRLEARRVEAALGAYSRDSRLIDQEKQACGRGLPPGVFAQVCGPDVLPLVDQRAFRLRDSLGKIKGRLGRRCEKAVRVVLARPISATGGPLAAAARVCRDEYERARTRGPN
ncbi:MAG TPA: hypothetical protein VKA89_07045 [Solirubrobacterales bacterium]|nr:hypothetical protein [Solirubrobacterales bacterium]